MKDLGQKQNLNFIVNLNRRERGISRLTYAPLSRLLTSVNYFADDRGNLMTVALLL